MAVELGTAYVSISASAKGIGKSISSELGQEMSGPLTRAGSDAGDQASRGFTSRFKSGLGGIAAVGRTAALGFTAGFAAVAGGALVAKSFVDAASDLQESMSKNNAVFRENAGTVDAWAGTAATAFGQSKQQALEAAGTFGNLFQAFGVGLKPATEMSVGLTELASDLASFNNTSVQEAIEALRSGLSGETEPLKRFGVALSDVRIREEALRQGLIKTTKDAMSPAVKAQAIYALTLKDTALAQGDFERTSGGLANQQKILGAQFTNLKAKIGTALLPAVTSAVSGLNDLGQKAMPRVKAALDGLVAGFQGAGDGGFFSRIGEASAKAVEIFQREWPRIREIIASALETARVVVVGFVTAVTTIWQNFGPQIIAFVTATWDQIKGTIDAALQIIRGIVLTITSLIRGDWANVWEGIKMIVSGVWDGIVALATGFVGRVRAVLSALLEILASIFRAAWEGARNAVVAGITKVIELIRALPGQAVAALAAIGSALVSRGAELIRGLITGITSLIEGYVNIIRGLPGRAIGALSGIGGALVSAGADLMRGFINGIKSMAGSIADAALAPVRGAVNAVKGFLGIGSPSKLFKEIGIDTMRGLGIGLEQGHDVIVNQTIRPAAATVGAFTPQQAPVPGSGVVITGNTFIGSGPEVTKLLDARIREGRRAGVQFLGV